MDEKDLFSKAAVEFAAKLTRESRTLKEEYKELLSDLESTKVIEASAGDLEVRTKLNKLISTMITVGSLVV